MRIDNSGAFSGTYHNSVRPVQPPADGSVGGPPRGVKLGLASGRADGVRASGSTGSKASLADPLLDDPLLDDPLLDGLVDSINRNLQAVNKRLQFLVHEGSGRVQVKVIDRSTDEVIREVPPEKLLDLVERLHDLIGLFVDETA